MFLKVLIFCLVVFGIVESSIWNIPKEFETTKTSTWCYPRGGKWDTDLKKCICYKNYYGGFCEKVKSCKFGLMINHECKCFYGWKGAECDQINCKYGIAVNNSRCECNPGISGTYCDTCLAGNQSPPNCFSKTTRLINENQQHPAHHQQCSTNLINYYLNIFLFILIAIYFTVNRILKRRLSFIKLIVATVIFYACLGEQAIMEQLNSRPILTPEMEALLLAKTHTDPDFIPCPRYDEILHSYPTTLSQEHPQRITVSEEQSLSPNVSIRIISLHV